MMTFSSLKIKGFLMKTWLPIVTKLLQSQLRFHLSSQIDLTELNLINRPGVAKAVLTTVLHSINLLHVDLPTNL